MKYKKQLSFKEADLRDMTNYKRYFYLEIWININAAGLLFLTPLIGYQY